MSSKKPPPTDDDLEDDFDYVEEEEEEPDDDFVPGDDAQDEDESDEMIVPLFHGTLSIDQDDILHYRGEGFHLSSVEAVAWNVLDPNVKPRESVHTIEMEGPCDIETGSGKSTHRKIQATWSVQDSTNGHAQLKREDDDAEKMSSLYYNVYGRQHDTAKGEILEFRGGYSPANASKEVTLVCQVRVVTSKPHVAATAAAATAKPAAARVDNEDDDDADADDDQIDYEELIALHQDAGVPVEDLRKRYRGGEASLPEKRGKSMPEEDDDDYGF